ncbi:mobilization protein, partial [Bacteroides thetaiotaomicron]|uniref:mobilization protein n=1 Tax=Bacteroides thetaiotaomicron TaxID=818 RepID=UPI001EE00630
TGITPQSNVMPPNIAAKEQASRVIEVVRALRNPKRKAEKHRTTPFVACRGSENAGGQSGRIYAHLTGTELLERSKQLEQEARENREKAGKLQTDLEIARQEKGTPAVGCNTHKILEIVERIDEVKKIPTFNDTVYEIDRNTLDMWVKRLKDELKR